jgi:prevent-host-death family protein
MSITETNMTSLRSHLADALDQVAAGDVVLVKRRGKPDAALVDSELLEDFLAATNPRIIKQIAEARTQVAAGETVPFEDVFRDVMGTDA